MPAFTEASTRRVPTPWGTEVKKRLLDRSLRQDDLVDLLQKQGSDITRQVLSNLLYGIGIGSRQAEIEAISRFLDIPYNPRSSA